MPARRRKNKENGNGKVSEKEKAKKVENTIKEISSESTEVTVKIKNQRDHFWEKRKFILFIGILIGLIVAAYTNKEHIKSDLIDDYVNFDNLSLDNLSKISDKFSVEEWKEYLPDSLKLDSPKGETGAFAIGKSLKKNEGLHAEHNVILVPGVISTGIESWGLEGTPDCPSTPYFRKRLWGSFFMLRTMLMEKACWLKHIMLDPETGLDPPGIKLRAAQGFEAADFFITGYWIWNKILENLAAIGYGPDNMFSAAYDWRLTYMDLERRDGFFSKLKAQIEMSKQLNGKKSVLVGHSMGSQVIFFFFKWVEAKGKGFGNGGKRWVNDHIEAYVDIAGSMLGTPKAITALLSGEMKDTVELNQLAMHGLEKFFSRKERAEMLRTFGGIPSMIPKGGNLVWGDMNGAPDDDDDNSEGKCQGDTFGKFLRFKENSGYSNMTMEESIEFLLGNGPEWFSNRVRENYSFGYARDAKEMRTNERDPRTWTNPLEVALPNAPDMKIFCFYGVGAPTERAYNYMPEEVSDTTNVIANDTDGLHHHNATKRETGVHIDSDEGVLFSNGDGTVSLLTHLHAHIWQRGLSMYNPGGSKVTIVELNHAPEKFDLRGGAGTAEHVDILGSAQLNALVLRVAGGAGSHIENSVGLSTLKKTADALFPL